MKEASFYEIINSDSAICQLCPFKCKLKENIISHCGSRILIKEKVYTLSYGQTIARNCDPIEKKPLYHFLPGSYAFSIGTPGCNLHCLHCQNHSLSQSNNSLDSNTYIIPEQIIKEAISSNSSSIAFTYSEPTIFFEYMMDIAKLSHEAGLKNVLISNGFINPEPLHQLIPLIDAANIDLKCFSEKTYHKLTGGSLQNVLETLKIIFKSNTHLEIAHLCIEGITDNSEDMQKMFQYLATQSMQVVPIHISRFFPYYKLGNHPATQTSRLYELKSMAIDSGLQYVYLGNIPDTSSQDTICPKCRTTVIRRKAYSTQSILDASGKCPVCNNQIIKVTS
jgi:pyruvate formate lyase activating enzyme